MKTVILNLLKPLLISLALLTTTVPFSIRAAANPLKTEMGPTSAKMTRMDSRITRLEQQNIAAEKKLDSRITKLEQQNIAPEKQIAFLGITLGLLLKAGSPLLGLMSLFLSLYAITMVKKKREEVTKLTGEYQSLLTRLEGVEVEVRMEQDKMEQEKVIYRNLAVAAPLLTLPSNPTPTPPSQPPWPVAQPAQDTFPGPEPISKESLIGALNTGDRQTLRAAARAELNITSESENALAMGKTIATQLEQVAGGGSYWLIAAEGHYWLFPTDRTLRGFAAARPSKGLFHYEQQTIAQPKLIEPALLESSGSCWSLENMGRIAIP
jgi:hypothetical protein